MLFTAGRGHLQRSADPNVNSNTNCRGQWSVQILIMQMMNHAVLHCPGEADGNPSCNNAMVLVRGGVDGFAAPPPIMLAIFIDNTPTLTIITQSVALYFAVYATLQAGRGPRSLRQPCNAGRRSRHTWRRRPQEWEMLTAKRVVYVCLVQARYAL